MVAVYIARRGKSRTFSKEYTHLQQNGVYDSREEDAHAASNKRIASESCTDDSDDLLLDYGGGGDDRLVGGSDDEADDCLIGARQTSGGQTHRMLSI